MQYQPLVFVRRPPKGMQKFPSCANASSTQYPAARTQAS